MILPKILSDFLNSNNLPSEDKAQEFLDKYSLDEQKLLVSCIYIGRDYVDFLRNPQAYSAEYNTPEKLEKEKKRVLSRDFLVSHLESEQFAEIVYEKQSNARNLYIPKLMQVAKEQNIDLNLPKYQD